jgi:hypothetical protein
MRMMLLLLWLRSRLRTAKPPGLEPRQTETAEKLDRWLRSPGLRPPT